MADDEQTDLDPRDQIIADVQAFAKERRVTILFAKREPMGLEVTWLYADRMGEGGGTATMNRLAQLCDQEGVVVTILPSDTRNKAFYERFDFVMLKDGSALMKRLPELPLEYWFAGSKITDASGEPLKLYHGTNSPEFKTFRTRRGHKESCGWNMGAHFADAPKAARVFGKRVMEVCLRMVNPLDVSKLGDLLNRATLESLGVLRPEEIRQTLVIERARSAFSTLEFLDKSFQLIPRLKRRGYDGIIFDGQEEGKTFVAFSPQQIRVVSHRVTLPEQVKKAEPNYLLPDDDTPSQEPGMNL